MMKSVVVAMLGVALSLPSIPSNAQAYPVKPIRTLIGFPTGNTMDLVARMIGAKISETIGQPVIVENRLGAGGGIAAEQTARAAPDGYTVLFASPSTHVTNVLLSKTVPYDPVKDFTPISPVAEAVLCVVVSATLPVKAMQELIAYARNNPGKLSYGSIGTGGTFHFVGEAIKAAAGVDILHVPYKGTGPVLTDMTSGLIQVGFLNLATSMPFIRSGKVRLLAMTDSQRYAGFPDIPTVQEVVPSYQSPSTWFGYYGPAAMPAALVRRLNAEIRTALSAADLSRKMDELALRVILGSPEDLAAMQARSMVAYSVAAKAAGLKPE